MTRVWCDKRNCGFNAWGVCQIDEIQIQGRGSIMEHVVCPLDALEEETR